MKEEDPFPTEDYLDFDWVEDLEIRRKSTGRTDSTFPNANGILDAAIHFPNLAISAIPSSTIVQAWDAITCTTRLDSAFKNEDELYLVITWPDKRILGLKINPETEEECSIEIPLDTEPWPFTFTTSIHNTKTLEVATADVTVTIINENNNESSV